MRQIAADHLVSCHRAEELKLVGVLVVLAGWALAILGLGISQSTGVRLVMAILGIVVSLVGILGVVNKAHQKDAPWKV